MLIKWIGLLTIGHKDSNGTFNNGLLRKDILVGLRDDGVLVWKGSGDQADVDNPTYTNKIEDVPVMPIEPVLPDKSTK